MVQKCSVGVCFLKWRPSSCVTSLFCMFGSLALSKYLVRSLMNVTEMWTTATRVPKQGCPPLVLDKVLWVMLGLLSTLTGGLGILQIARWAYISLV